MIRNKYRVVLIEKTRRFLDLLEKVGLPAISLFEDPGRLPAI